MREFIVFSLGDLFRNFKKVIALFAVLGLVNGTINYLQAPYALYVINLKASTTSIIIGLVLFITTIIIVFLGKLTDKYGISNSIYISLILIILGAFIQILNKTDVLFYFISQVLLNEGVLLGTNSLVTYITMHSNNTTTSSIFGGTSSFFFFGTAIVAELIHVLYIYDPLYPYWFLIAISILIFPFTFIFKEKRTKNYLIN